MSKAFCQIQRDSSSAIGPKSSSANASKSRTIDENDSALSKKPSDWLNPKTVNHFNTTKTANCTTEAKMSTFAKAYESQRIPCRLAHGSVKHKLTWSQPIETVAWNPILLYLAEGLCETVFPYNQIAVMGFQQMLERADAGQFVPQLLPILMPTFRTTIRNATKSQLVFENVVSCLELLSNVVHEALNPFVKQLVAALFPYLSDRKLGSVVLRCLNILEKNGGAEVHGIIKSKIPTYS